MTFGLASVSKTNKIKFAYLLFGPVSLLAFAFAAPLFVGAAVLHLNIERLRFSLGGIVHLHELWSVLVEIKIRSNVEHDTKWPT